MRRTPRPRVEAVRIVDMTSSNSWAEFAGVFCQTRGAFLNHEAAKAELKKEKLRIAASFAAKRAA